MQEIHFTQETTWNPLRLRIAFRELAKRCDLKEGDVIFFAGCPGGCYSQATLFSSYLRDLNLRIYFIPDADPRKAHPIEYSEELGFTAGSKTTPPKAKIIVAMSGLCRIPIDPLIQLVSTHLQENGKIIAESNNPGIYESLGWDKKINFDYKIEFAVDRVKLSST